MRCRTYPTWPLSQYCSRLACAHTNETRQLRPHLTHNKSNELRLHASATHLALTALEARVVLRADADNVADLDVRDFRADADGLAEDLVADDLRVVDIAPACGARQIKRSEMSGGGRERREGEAAWANVPPEAVCKSDAQMPQYMILMSTSSSANAFGSYSCQTKLPWIESLPTAHQPWNLAGTSEEDMVDLGSVLCVVGDGEQGRRERREGERARASGGGWIGSGSTYQNGGPPALRRPKLLPHLPHNNTRSYPWLPANPTVVATSGFLPGAKGGTAAGGGFCTASGRSCPSLEMTSTMCRVEGIEVEEVEGWGRRRREEEEEEGGGGRRREEVKRKAVLRRSDRETQVWRGREPRC